ncbi:MAG: hypothetical protein ISQ14_08175 [Verrucomicrobiae bacterium]|nr:hypothetical protein [Verrucomicrobiae bacterium]
MDYFKFTCPHCHSRIGTSPDTVGQHVSCPSCAGDVIIPPAPENEGEVVAGIAPETHAPVPHETEAAEHTMMLRRSDLEDKPAPAQFEDEPKIPDMATLNEDNPFGAPAAPPKPPAPKAPEPKPEAKAPPTPTPAPIPSPKVGEGANADQDDDEDDGKASKKKKEPAPEPLINNLTPEVKVGLLRQARTHIDTEDKWIHGRSGPGGKHVLAARMSGDSVIPEKPGSPDATHYSIVGALVVAMDEIRVKSTAGGRSEFLHQEMEAATRKVTGKAEGEKADPMDLGHKECLAVLDQMLKHYQRLLGDKSFEKLLKGIIDTSVDSRTTGALNAMLSSDEADLNLLEVIKAVVDELDQLKKRIDQLENN